MGYFISHSKQDRNASGHWLSIWGHAGTPPDGCNPLRGDNFPTESKIDEANLVIVM